MRILSQIEKCSDGYWHIVDHVHQQASLLGFSTEHDAIGVLDQYRSDERVAANQRKQYRALFPS